MGGCWRQSGEVHQEAGVGLPTELFTWMMMRRIPDPYDLSDDWAVAQAGRCDPCKGLSRQFARWGGFPIKYRDAVLNGVQLCAIIRA